MIDDLLRNLDTLLIGTFAAMALGGAVLMLVLRHPMQVAMALISTMVALGAIYGLLGVHFIAAFQVLIYVGAVMVFMVFAIMLLDVRDASFVGRFSRYASPAIVAAVALVAVLGYALWAGIHAPAAPTVSFRLQEFAVTFVNEYWLLFELTSVLLVAAVAAALAVLKEGRRDDA